MSNSKIRFTKILIGVLVTILVLVIGVTFLASHVQRTQWILKIIDTQAMADTRALLPNKRLITKSILETATKVDKNTLHAALLYPQVHTVICTVDRPEAYAEFAAYLVSDKGETFPGWYNPENMGDIASERYGVVKIMFEGLTTNQIKELHLVDKSMVTIPYEADSDIPKIVYTLNSPTNSEVESMTSAAAAAAGESSSNP